MRTGWAVLARLFGYVPLSSLLLAEADAAAERARADRLAERLVDTERKLWRLVDQRLLALKDIRTPLSVSHDADPVSRTSGLGNIGMSETR